MKAEFLIGLKVSSSHPITCLNPTKYFKIKEINIENNKLYVRGENTMWFEADMITRYKDDEIVFDSGSFGH